MTQANRAKLTVQIEFSEPRDIDKLVDNMETGLWYLADHDWFMPDDDEGFTTSIEVTMVDFDSQSDGDPPWGETGYVQPRLWDGDAVA